MLEIVLFDRPCLLTTPSLVLYTLYINAASIVHAQAQFR